MFCPPVTNTSVNVLTPDALYPTADTTPVRPSILICPVDIVPIPVTFNPPAIDRLLQFAEPNVEIPATFKLVPTMFAPDILPPLIAPVAVIPSAPVIEPFIVIPDPMISPPPFNTLISEPATVLPTTRPLPIVCPPPIFELSVASNSPAVTVPVTLKSAPPVTVPWNVDIPATDRPAPTLSTLIFCVEPNSTVPTKLPPIDILPPNIRSPLCTLTVPINPPASPTADIVLPTPKKFPTLKSSPTVLTPAPLRNVGAVPLISTESTCISGSPPMP